MAACNVLGCMTRVPGLFRGEARVMIVAREEMLKPGRVTSPLATTPPCTVCVCVCVCVQLVFYSYMYVHTHTHTHH